ncbi:MAG: SRPBCC domain-containing protein [Pseudomonadota bacterium]
MELTGRYRIERDRETVLAALSDPEVLRTSTPFLDRLEVLGPGRFAGALGLRFGLLALRVDGFAEVEPIDPPEQFQIRVGRGRSGGRRVGLRLEEGPQGWTTVSYHVAVGGLGPFALFGAPWVERTAAEQSHRFFAAVARSLGARGEPA